jgi:hypothetical protein
VDELAEKVAGKAHDELVFPGTRGSALRVRVVRRGGFDAAIERLSLAPMHPHEVRHTAASLAMVSGADVKVVQQMLGHKSATMTLDLYGHLFGDRLDEVADALDVAARRWCIPSVSPTSCSGSRREASKCYRPRNTGPLMRGDEGTRTPNPRLANAFRGALVNDGSRWRPGNTEGPCIGRVGRRRPFTDVVLPICCPQPRQSRGGMTGR